MKGACGEAGAERPAQYLLSSSGSGFWDGIANGFEHRDVCWLHNVSRPGRPLYLLRCMRAIRWASGRERPAAPTLNRGVACSDDRAAAGDKVTASAATPLLACEWARFCAASTAGTALLLQRCW